MSGYIEKYVDGSYTHTLKIPDSWVFVELYEAINIIGGSQPPKSEFHSEFKEGLIRLIQIRDYKSDAHKVYIPLEKAKRFVSPDDVMIGRYGPPIFQILRGLEGAYNVALMKAVPIQGVLDNKYLFHFLNNRDIYNYVDSASDRTAGQSGVNKSHLEKYPVGIPPLAEQKVIADKLDELLAQVESTKARLDAIPATLKSFRESVLATAMSGKLTEEWRDGKKLNPENDLKCELSLNEGKKRKIEATSSHELVSDNFSISWSISKFDELYRFIDYRGKTPKKSEYGKRLYTAKNIKMGYLSNEPVEYLSEEDYKSWMTRGFSKMNDIFFVTEGHTMGCVAINTIGSDIALAQRTLTLQPYGNVRTKFHYYFMLTNSFQKLVDLNATGTAAKGIKASKFRGLPLPFPTYEEQTEIVRRVEELFAFAAKVEAQVNAAQTRVNNLTQSILAKAFRGELTAEWRAANPDLINGENSAAALLERIKAEREALAGKKKPAKKTKAKKAKI